jgi:hypothetical protein
MHWPIIWRIFPLACMVMVVVMFLFMAGVGGMRCMPWARRVGKPGSPGGVRQSFDERSSPSSTSQSSSMASQGGTGGASDPERGPAAQV